MMPQTDEMVSEAKSIVREADVCGGVPTLEGTRIRVSDVVVAYDHQGLSPDEVAAEFEGLKVQDVHSALAFYHARPEEIREEIRERERRYDREQRQADR